MSTIAKAPETRRFIHIPPMVFNMMLEKRHKRANCLGYAFGQMEVITLPYKGLTIDEAFRKKAAEYGILVRQVSSMADIGDDCKAFLVYGFYKMPDVCMFGCRIPGEMNDFHIVYRSPSGLGFHKPDAVEMAQCVIIDPMTGGIPEYEEGPAAIFVIDDDTDE